jgi:AcrR family transcriptional regulator
VEATGRVGDADRHGTGRLEAPEQSHVRGPTCWLAKASRCGEFRVVEEVLDHRVVQVADGNGAEPPHRADEPPVQHVTESATVLVEGVDGQFVEADDPRPAVEGPSHPPSGCVLRHVVADRSVPAIGSDLDRAVHPHRVPGRRRPQSVAVTSDAVEQFADHRRRCVDHPFVHVVDHRRLHTVAYVEHTVTYGSVGANPRRGPGGRTSVANQASARDEDGRQRAQQGSRRGERRLQLTAEDWARAALAVVAERGLDGVAVEPLAERLGTTKGSFYWHFANRRALLEAALGLWEQDHTEALIAALEAEPDPRARLQRLFSLVVDSTRQDRLEVALLATADDPLVAPVVGRVTERRIAYVASLYEELGIPADLARRHGVLAVSVSGAACANCRWPR